MVKKAKRWETMDKGNIPLDKLILQLEALNRSEGKTEKTVQWYNQTLHLLNEWLRQNGYSNLLRDLDLELIRTYIFRSAPGMKVIPTPLYRTLDSPQRALTTTSVPSRPSSTGSTEKAIPQSQYWKGSGSPRSPKY